jgi:hypothetical protein
MNTFEELTTQIMSLIQMYINDKIEACCDTTIDTDDISELSAPEYPNIPNTNILETLNNLRNMEKKELDDNVNYYYKNKKMITCEYCNKEINNTTKNIHYKGKKCLLARSLI